MRTPGIALWALACLGLSPALAAPLDDVDRPATVLLITAAELAEAWEPFAAWKTRCGKSTRIVTVESIAADYPGVDVQARIKACVLDHVRGHGTRWVVLGGDSLPGGRGLVPDRDTRHAIQGGRLRYADIPTDLYYVTAEGWDADGDGVYGDYRADRDAIGWTSLAAIGRIPVRTPAQVAAYTQKVIGYETRYPVEGFATRLLYANAVRQANYKAELVWDDHLERAWPQGGIDLFFVDRTPWDGARPGDYALSPGHWVERINAATHGKLHMHGHGFLPGWVLERNQLADAQTVSALRNEDAYLLMTTVSCFTGHYDDAQDPSITEAMLRQPRGGAVAIVAPAREGVPVFHAGADPRHTQDGTTRLLTRFWARGLAEDLTTGEALAAAKDELAADAARSDGYHWVLSELNLLGDPTLDMRARDPITPALAAPARLAVGARELTVDVGRPGLRVCAYQPGGVYAVARSDAAGRARLTLGGQRAGELSLTVSGPSANTVTRTLTVDGRRWFK